VNRGNQAREQMSHLRVELRVAYRGFRRARRLARRARVSSETERRGQSARESKAVRNGTWERVQARAVLKKGAGAWVGDVDEDPGERARALVHSGRGEGGADRGSHSAARGRAGARG
jgi:hypothetical protein